MFVRFVEVPDETLQKLQLWNAGLRVNGERAALNVSIPLATKYINVIAKEML